MYKKNLQICWSIVQRSEAADAWGILHLTQSMIYIKKKKEKKLAIALSYVKIIFKV